MMNRMMYGVLLLAGTAAGWFTLASAQVVRPGNSSALTTPIAPPQAQTQATVAAATAFLNTLSAEQRSKVQFAFVPQPKATAANFKGGMGGRMTFVGEQYGQAVWSNFPVSDVTRPGVQLGSLSAQQRESAMHLLQVLLSPKGYQKVLAIMGSDQALADGGTHFAAGKDTYTLALFGPPSATAPWLVQFGGHHLGLNVLIAGAHGVLTPTLTGAQPAVYQSQGKTVRVLAQENDKAFALLNALDAAQRQKAMLTYEVRDLVLGPGHDGETIVPEGLKGSEMTAAQQAMLLDLMGEWAGIIQESYVKARITELKAGLNDTYFAWSGPTTHAPDRNGTSYYRIQGPKVVIEFSPQGVGGDPSMHVHTIYRDPTNEYGHAFTSR
ncbi:DUF3500 domain-containing protein [Hymenobacter convexus]|uniref:DUF3500 domain-containing protein n=1 Tax=Hymenobacter sp. CA1UV-4 TaxID=3063782 RepID=UPI002712DA41|nr:DUF3500 domain-containing protein [Hymenobacter sp. CA1UV-4]MDO7854074.1 DUF3500 domain-containing protein [Hymenobacter sp. CA1UV-4]